MTGEEPGEPLSGFPSLEDVEGAAYELRLTRRALHDLGCDAETAPGDLTDIADQAEQGVLVNKFASLRRNVPTGTDGPMHNVGRPDIYSLHGFNGDRACTWYDADEEVCWLLGWVAQHDYIEFETRAANSELLPDEDDYIVLEVEREELEFAHQIAPGVRKMLAKALVAPGQPVRHTVGELLQLEVSVLAEPVGEDQLIDVFLTVRVPPIKDPPPGWPGRELPTRLAEFAADGQVANLDLDFPAEVPDAAGGVRPLDFGHELAVTIRGLVIEDASL